MIKINKKCDTEKVRAFRWVLPFLSLLFLGTGFLLSYWFLQKEKLLSAGYDGVNPEEQTLTSVFDGLFEHNIRTFDEIKRGESLASTLSRLKVRKEDGERMVKAFSSVIDLKNIKEGTPIMVESRHEKIAWEDVQNKEHETSLYALEIFLNQNNSLSETICAYFENPLGEIKIIRKKSVVEKKYKLYSGEVKDSLYQSMVKNGADPQLVSNFADIFAWQVDFYRETKEGDIYNLIVEENIIDGASFGLGQILAAEYITSSRDLKGYYFSSADGQTAGYYDEEGKSLKNAFLKSPLKLAQITSRFGMRFHPVQHRMKPHNGVDYGAVKGTPIMAVASGSVVNAGFNPFSGNWVRIRHMNGYETEYLHATHLAKGIRVGAKVKQGQVIAFVGRTGLATGYHLHFGMKKDGAYVDPVRQKFARAEILEKKYLSEFKKRALPLGQYIASGKIDKERLLAKD